MTTSTENRAPLSKDLLFLILRTLATVILFMAMTPPGRGQYAAVTPSVAPPVPGAGHDYIQFLNETVNPANGSVSIRIKVPTPADRALQLPFAFGYDSNAAHHFAMPVGNLSWNASASSLSQGGWTYELPYETFTASISFQSPQPTQASVSGDICPYYYGFTITDMNGTPHETGISVPTNLSLCAANGEGPTTGLSGGDNILFAITTTPANATQQTPPAPLTATDADGTVYYFANAAQSLSQIITSGQGSPPTCCYLPGSDIGLPTYVEDRNGNRLTFTNNGANGISIADDIGRTVLSTSGFGATGDTVTVAGLPSSYATTWTTEPYSFQMQEETIAPQAILFPDPAWSCGTGQSQTYSQNVSISGSQPEITSLTLPNGQSYSFAYESKYGMIQKITYPTGAYVRYVWGPNPGYASTQLFPPYSAGGTAGNNPSIMSEVSCEALTSSIVVLNRFVSFNGSTEVLEQDFTYSPALSQAPSNNPSDVFQRWSSDTTTVVTKDLVRNNSYTTTYSYTSSPPLPQTYYFGMPQLFTGVYDSMPEETQVAATDFSGNTLRLVNETYTSPYALPIDKQTALNGMPISEIQTIYGTLDGSFLLPTDTCTYSPSGSTTPCASSNSLLQHTHTDYATVPSTPVGGIIADRPADAILYNGQGATVAETLYTLDHAAMSTETAAGHDDPNFPASYVTRGNTTNLTRECFTASGTCPNSVTSYTYYQTGQLATSLDAIGNQTQYTYSDKFTDTTPSTNTSGYLTQIQYPTTNGVPHTEQLYYRYSDGQVSQALDQNQQETTYCYTTGGCSGATADPWGRLTGTTYPDAGQVINSYNDAGPNPSVTTCALFNGASNATCSAANPPAGWKTTVATFDGTGHAVQTALVSDPYGTNYVTTCYDGSGSVYEQTNPYRGTAIALGVCPSSSTPFISYSYDSLGRKILQTQQDGTSTQQWSYNGNVTTFANEDNNTWQRTFDAIGRLTNVVEPSLARTYYTYDPLGDLTCAAQDGGSGGVFSSCAGVTAAWRPRSFSYDSLSRLTSATNPETGVVTYSYLSSGAPCAGDPALPCSKQDARGVTTVYSYDALNRTLSKTYGSDPNATPFSCFQYDLSSVTHGIGRLANEWTQKATAGNCSSTLPASGSYVTAKQVGAYDPMGRLWSETQCTPSGCRSANPCQTSSNVYQSYSYDLVGNLICYPNGIPSTPGAGSNPVAFTQSFDGAGRLATLTTNMNTPSETLFAAQGYAAFGGLTSATYGSSGSSSNAVTLTRTYDPRLRISSEIDLGNSPGVATSGGATITITGAEQSK